MTTSRMNSNKQSASRLNSSRQIILSREQFEAIYQVTIELRNYQEERLIREGMTAQKLDTLTDLVRSLREPAEQSSKVRIHVVESPIFDALATSGLEAELDESQTEWEAVGQLPEAIAVTWQSLLRFVVSSLGDREIFLRTGYDANEVSDAISALLITGVPK
jgi:hypothetical protein